MLKKQQFKNDEIKIFDDAIIYKRGSYWHFRMWLEGENKYARKSLRTRSKSTAVELGKKAYIEISGNLLNGKTYFSITTKEGVALYVEYRQKDVDVGLIVAGRLSTIRTHLQHWLDFIKKDTKLKELESTDCEDYFSYRKKTNNAKQTTVQQEQSTINACIKWLQKNGETHIDGFDFKKLRRLDRGNEAIRRATLTNVEYNSLCKVMVSYCAKKNQLDAGEHRARQIVRHFVLIAANSGLRVGELKQLRWSDMKELQHTKDGVKLTLAQITVRAETSKVRKTRTLACRRGEFFGRLRDLTNPSSDDEFIFGISGDKALSERTLLQHWHKMIELAEIDDSKARKLVPYCLRHFMITQRVMSGLSYRDIADMCGTSATQIENTYYHLNDKIRRTNAVADYRIMKDGTIKLI